MKKIRLLITCCLFVVPTFGQVQQGEKVPILLTDICVDGVCFGDSISKLVSHFGQPDTMMHSPSGDWEFAEPNHMVYRYFGLRFYEILYPNLSKDLFYGCMVRAKGIVVSIKNKNLVVGVTTVEHIINDFTPSITSVEKSNEREQAIALCTALPTNLKSIEGAFIREIVLRFTDNILTEVETYFDLN